MIGNVARIGELHLEKSHQVLKRAIRQSNRKEVQIQSVQSAIFNDWHGRLSLQVPRALRGETSSELGCYRLLFGRVAVFSLRGSLSADDRNLVYQILGPRCCVPAWFESQAKYVVCPRVVSKCLLKWSLYSKPESIGHNSDQLWSLAKSKTNKLFQTVSDLIGIALNIEFGYHAQLKGPNDLRVLSIHVGDIIDVKCTHGKDFFVSPSRI